MAAFATRVEHSDRMMIAATWGERGIEFTFADGCTALVPYADLPEVGALANIKSVELPNAYEALVHTNDGETVELPWDFARPYGDPAYRARVESIGEQGRKTLGDRIRQLRRAAGLTQEELSAAANIGRVTLVRIENGEQSPRFETLTALATALNHPPATLLTPAPR